MPNYIKCQYCGDNCSVRKFPKKKYIARKELFNTKEKAISCDQKETEKGKEVVRFSGFQIVRTQKVPPKIINSGFTIILFKGNEIFNGICEGKTRLVTKKMQGKIGKKVGNISNLGEVWFDPTTISNIYGLSNMAQRSD